MAAVFFFVFVIFRTTCYTTTILHVHIYERTRARRRGVTIIIALVTGSCCIPNEATIASYISAGAGVRWPFLLVRRATKNTTRPTALL